MHERANLALRAALLLILPALGLGACGSSSGGNAAVPDGGKKDTGAGQSSGMASLKFCNGLELAGNMTLRLSLEVGTAPLVLTADSGNCSTVVNAACKMVAPGEATVTLVDAQHRMIASGKATFAAGEQWVMLATIDDATMKPALLGAALDEGETCSAFNPFEDATDGGTTPPPADAGAGG
jgi:hypothetical protein